MHSRKILCNEKSTGVSSRVTLENYSHEIKKRKPHKIAAPYLNVYIKIFPLFVDFSLCVRWNGWSDTLRFNIIIDANLNFCT